jgi:hypothetical protein
MLERDFEFYMFHYSVYKNKIKNHSTLYVFIYTYMYVYI